MRAFFIDEYHYGGLGMKVIVKKWGNSASVRIPASVMAAANISLDQPVEVREEHGRVIIDPIRPPAYDIASLIAAITDENRHEEIDFGPAMGEEIA
jgi:antitoxin MazE